MRIISNFRDYYDSAQAYGDDDSLMYKRRTEEIDLTNKKPDLYARVRELVQLFSRMPMIPAGVSGSRFLVAFCGKAYSFYSIRDYTSPPDMPWETNHHYYLNVDEFFAYLAKNPRLVIGEGYPHYKRKGDSRYGRADRILARQRKKKAQ